MSVSLFFREGQMSYPRFREGQLFGGGECPGNVRLPSIPTRSNRQAALCTLYFKNMS